MFVTHSEHLAAKSKQAFEHLYESHVLGCRTASVPEGPERTMIDADEEMRWNTTIPQRLAELCDEHFPLFVSYDRVRAYPYLIQSL